MYKYEFDYTYMRVMASDAQIINEIIIQLDKKNAGGITLQENTIEFQGGVLCGVILRGSLLCGVTKGKITIEGNKIRYSLSYFEIFVALLIMIPFFIMILYEDFGISPVTFIIPSFILFFAVLGPYLTGNSTFRKFLKKCIMEADKKAEIEKLQYT